MRHCVLVEGAFDSPEPLIPVLLRAGFAPPARCDSLASALAVMQKQPTELLILPIRAAAGSEKLSLEVMMRDVASLAVIGTSAESSADVVLNAMRSGISEFLMSQASAEELTGAIQRLERRWAMAPVRGEITAIFTPKGGQGGTTVAVNLAHAIARKRGKRVVVVDLVIGLGDVALQLNLRPEYDIGELAQKMDRIDRDLIQSVAAVGPDGLSVLAATDRLDLAPILTGDLITALLNQCRQTYEHTVVDCEHAFDPRTVATLDAADRILLVAQLQVSSLVVAKRSLNIFRELGYDDDKIHVVINREGSTKVVNITEAQKVLGRKIDGRIPNDFQTASDAQAQGVPFLRHAAGSALAKSYDTLAARFLAPSETGAASPAGGSPAELNGATRRGRLFGLLKR
jgi:pilus assembly protein CpaE